MTEHLKAWDKEYRSSKWKGPYSLEMLDAYHGNQDNVDNQNIHDGKSECDKGRLLDAGCGSGKYSIPLKMRGFDVVAIDVSKKALEMAYTSSTNRNLDMDYLAASICNTPFQDASFDMIWCYGVLQHLLSDERVQAINEFSHILKKDGVLFLEVFGRDDMRYGGTEVEPDTFSRDSGIVYHYFEKKELEGLLESFSCEIIESRKEKKFRGKCYTRHMISVTAQKQSNI
ncbi:MAG: class I SAM-dependent methyltransferase [Methanosarcinales archaeon]|nr:class I SAM-dependent methyltransferase [Methanosarcinales archaeon]